jgi:hypothetical protein
VSDTTDNEVSFENDTNDFSNTCKKLCDGLPRYIQNPITFISFEKEKCEKCTASSKYCQYRIFLIGLDNSSLGKANRYIYRKDKQKNKCDDCHNKFSLFLDILFFSTDLSEEKRKECIRYGRQFLKIIDNCCFKIEGFNEFLAENGDPCQVPVEIKRKIRDIRQALAEEEAQLLAESACSRARAKIYYMWKSYDEMIKLGKNGNGTDKGLKIRNEIIKDIRRTLKSVRNLGISDSSFIIQELKQGLKQLEDFSRLIEIPFLLKNKKKFYRNPVEEEKNKNLKKMADLNLARSVFEIIESEYKQISTHKIWQ